MSRRVVIVGYDDAGLLDIACPTDAFDVANRLGAVPKYSVQLTSLNGQQFLTLAGIPLAPEVALSAVTGPIDTLVVPGGLPEAPGGADPRLVGEVARLARSSRRIMSVCAGAFVLAAAGILDGKRATTHYSLAEYFSTRYPTVRLDPAPIFVCDGNVYTSSGMVSGLDLSLALIEADHGTQLARNVARAMVAYLQRPGGQSQVSMHLAADSMSGADLIRTASDYIRSNLDGSLDVERIATAIAVSPRHLSRLFANELGSSPGRYIRQMRAEAAANMLTMTTWPIAVVAIRSGFGSGETLRAAFRESYGVTPLAYRRSHSPTLNR